MNILEMAARSINIGDEVKQDNEDLRIDVEKLINIANDLVYMTDDFIYGVYVSPMSILQTKLSDVKTIKFHIVYNNQYVGDALSDKKEVCTELINSFCTDEFDGMKGIEKVDYSTSLYQKESYLLLFSVFGEININELKDNDIKLLWSLLSTDKYTVSLPNTFPYEDKHSILIHCNDYSGITYMITDLNSSLDKYGVEIKQEESKSIKLKAYAYIPIVGHKSIGYTLPYTYITKDTFNNQFVDHLLNNNQ